MFLPLEVCPPLQSFTGLFLSSPLAVKKIAASEFLDKCPDKGHQNLGHPANAKGKKSKAEQRAKYITRIRSSEEDVHRGSQHTANNSNNISRNYIDSLFIIQ
jgi:hypothetical protein